MDNKNRILKRFILGILFCCILVNSKVSFCNNLSLTDGSIIEQDTSLGTIKFQFSISWENSWRDGINYDAAWVFAKYSVDGGKTWNHATLKTSGTNPANFSLGSGTDIDIKVPTDKKGCFIQRKDDGTGTLAASAVKIVWDYKTDGVSDFNANSPNTIIKLFGVEMVYIPEASFSAGDSNADLTGAFKNGKTNSSPISISSESALSFNDENAGPYYYQTGGNAGEWISGATFTVSSVFPKGYKAFYIMKYEISQGQWVDFFNIMTSDQKTTRDITSSANEGKNSDDAVKRNAVVWTSGMARTLNGRENDRACNFLSWMDLCAYADWAALRPMTEFEFEKACRGPTTVANNEYAWGNTTIVAAGAISGTEDGTETITTANANCCYGDANFNGSGDGGKGPIRCGIFAKSTTNRTLSGSSYYGVMELSGNVWERCVTIGNSDGLNFSGTHGDGVLTTSGNATNSDWPGIDSDAANGITGASGSGFRGGAFDSTDTELLMIADRSWAAKTENKRSDISGGFYGYGGRCARTAP